MSFPFNCPVCKSKDIKIAYKYNEMPVIYSYCNSCGALPPGVEKMQKRSHESKCGKKVKE